MRTAETVTFGGSGLDRAANLRGDVQVVEGMLRDPATRVLPVWRGKPLFSGEPRGIGWLAPGDAVLAQAAEAAVFLGLDAGVPRFAMDISAWQPEEVPDTLGAFLDPSEQRHPDLPPDHAFGELRANMTRLSAREAELVATAKAVLGWHESHRFCARCGARSRMIEAGWQRQCPDCGARHFPRTDPVVIMLILSGNDVLMGRSPGWPEGMYSLLAGFIEPGETLEAAVRREVREETGVEVSRVGYLASQPWPFPASLMMGCRGEALSRDIRVDPAELEDARWVGREEMLDIMAGRSGAMKPARKGAIAHFLIEAWLADRLDEA
jgi:NAD+ diphosphatase